MQSTAPTAAVTDDAMKTAEGVESRVEAGHRVAGVEVGHRPARTLRDRGPRPRLPTPTLPEAGMSPVWEGLSDSTGVGLAWGYRASLRRDAIFRRGLAIADVAAAYAALLIATLLISDGGPHLRVWAFLIAPLVVVASKAIGLYDRDQHTLRKTTVDELPSILHIAVFYALGGLAHSGRHPHRVTGASRGFCAGHHQLRIDDMWSRCRSLRRPSGLCRGALPRGRECSGLSACSRQADRISGSQGLGRGPDEHRPERTEPRRRRGRARR